MSNIALVFLPALLIHWAFPPSTSAGRLREFHIGPDRVNRETAVEECKINYTGLVTVYDQQDNIELYKLMKSNRVFIGWIGTCRGNRSTKWSNGDDVTFNRNLIGDCGEICCGAMKADGGWESLQCSEKKHFMCYEQALDVGPKSRNYRLIRENRTWFEAQRYCRQNHTDLVSIRDQTENERVKEAGEQSKDPFWIGLLEDSVAWADGGQSAYRNWSPNSGNNYAKTTMIINGSWFTQSATNPESHPLCYKSFIHVSAENMSWEDALDYCNNHTNTTGLLTIQSENDQIETDREIKRRKISGPFWVGLRQSRLFGFWIWIDGINMGNWSNWKGGSQPEHLISEHCGALEKVDGQYKWSDKDCRSNFTVLCKKKKKVLCEMK